LLSGLLPLFVLAHFAHHLLGGLLTPLLPFIRDEFVLDYTQAGLVISAFTLSYGISQLPAGWLADHIGPRKLVTIGISGIAFFGLMVGLSTTYIMMIVFLVLMGVAGGGYHPASTPLISASVESKSQGQVLGLHQVGGTASGFLAPLVAIATAATLGWRGSFMVIAIPTILLGVVFYVLLGWQRYTKKAKQRMLNSVPEIPPTPRSLRPLIAFLILSIVSQALIFSTISFIPLFIVDHFRVGKEVAVALFALVHLAGFWAGPLGGYLSDRLGRVPVALAVSFIAGPIIYLLNLVPYGWGVSAVLLAIGMSRYIPMPVFEAYIISQTSERKRSTVLGIYYFGSRGGPGILIPIIGYLIDQFGFYASFTFVGITLLTVTLVCSIFLWRSRD
jgi:MFS family permease